MIEAIDKALKDMLSLVSATEASGNKALISKTKNLVRRLGLTKAVFEDEERRQDAYGDKKRKTLR